MVIGVETMDKHKDTRRAIAEAIASPYVFGFLLVNALLVIAYLMD